MRGKTGPKSEHYDIPLHTYSESTTVCHTLAVGSARNALLLSHLDCSSALHLLALLRLCCEGVGHHTRPPIPLSSTGQLLLQTVFKNDIPTCLRFVVKNLFKKLACAFRFFEYQSL